MNRTGTARRSLIERAAEKQDLTLRLARPAAGTPVAAETPPHPEPLADRHRDCGRRGAIAREPLAEAGFILPDMVPTALAEEFRIVKRQLLQGVFEPGAGPEARAIIVCSAQPDEGKTFCAVNLALSMAREKDIEVLLVDADFAKPEILSTLGLEGGPGLLDMLAEPGLRPEDCVIRTDFDNFSVLPAGRAINEATELLASDRARLVFEDILANPSRVVIFDSAPVLATSTTSVLAGLVGQVMMVVRADVTGDRELREALALLSRCPTIRLLLNATEMPAQARRFGGYYGYGS